MGSTGDFHLTFDPPATDEQLKSVRDDLYKLDYDAPIKDVISTGTTRGEFGDVALGGEEYAYWRKPMYDVTNEALTDIMEAHGLNGHGFLIEHYGREPRPRVESCHRFVFGQGE